ncbi:hypothetical protein [Ferrimonas senticii]|uniref:hypothetical protein n=1 Tax=Ferrimonas senticii TaxID=394566 RepID=UPI000406351C|nr:hypothetical protein [Ferrimonas senticii]
MFLVSNFPQVPIATSNPATDSAAREQQLRPAMPAPEALAKSQAERGIDPERQHSDKVQRKGTSARQSQSQSEPESQRNKGRQRQSLKSLLAEANPTIDRPGRRRRGSEQTEASSVLALTDAQYQAFGQIIARAYRRRVEPPPARQLLSWT